MSIQTTYPFSRAAGYAGALAEGGPHRVKSVRAEVAIPAGLIVARGENGVVGTLPGTPDAASATAIVATGGASAASSQTISGAALNGAVGGNELVPPRNLTITLSSNAHWLATTATVTGLDSEGQVIQEDFRIPASGAVTLTGSMHFARVTSIFVPAQGGTAGTFTVGTGSSLGSITGAQVHGVAVYDASREPGAWPINSSLPVCDRGPVFVNCETSYVDGQNVFVRFIATGNEVAGHVRATADANDCALLVGARFRGDGGAGLAVIDLNL